MKKLLIVALMFVTAAASAAQLERTNVISNKTTRSVESIQSNQIGFKTDNIPAGVAATVHCQLDNQADFSGYLYVTPFSGSFLGVDYQTCTPSGCGRVASSKVYLGMANTVINIYGVKQSNQAIILTNYSMQNMNVVCWF